MDLLAATRAVLLVAAATLSTAPLAAQATDSLQTPVAPPSLVVVPDSVGPDNAAERTPRGALVRSLAVPGWGQLYNGQRFKAPIAVGAVVGTAVYAVFQHDRYLLYRHAFLYQQREEAGQVPNEFARFEDEWIEAGSLGALQLRRLRDNNRGNRDIAILLVGVAYTLQALDAYVAAHLTAFDVSEDLSLAPTPIPGGVGLGFSVDL